MHKSPTRPFSCTGCGDCCRGRGDYYVAVTPAEQQRIRRYLALSPAWFARRYIDRDDDGDSLRWEASGRCVFLSADDQCRIYPVRPRQCRTYPFWPEIVVSARAWNDESRHCEGMKRVTEIRIPASAIGRSKRRPKRD